MPDMNCDELLYFYFENDVALPDGNRNRLAAEVADHVRVCADCRNFVDAQRELGARLRLLRDSAPQISTYVDSAVLVNYRRRVDKPTASTGSTAPRKRTSRLATIVWRGGIAAAIIVILLLAEKRTPTTAIHEHAEQAMTMRQATSMSNKLTAEGETAHPLRRQSPTHRSSHGESAVPVMSNSLPTEFQSLMYCDQLSCAGTMDVIRMQLPASAEDSAPASGTANGTVLADVLVGADGIARGVRIVE
jgi:hypothetical protein